MLRNIILIVVPQFIDAIFHRLVNLSHAHFLALRDSAHVHVYLCKRLNALKISVNA